MDTNSKILYICLDGGSSIRIKLHNARELTEEEKVEYDKHRVYYGDWEDE